MNCKLKTILILDVGYEPPASKTHVLPRSVLDLLKMKSPEGAITGAYGKEGIKTLKASVTAHSRLSTSQFCQEVGFEVVRDVEPSTRISLQQLPSVKTLNLLRVNKDTAETIRTFWSTFFRHRFPASEQDFPSVPTAHPEKIANLQKTPLFNHIDLFIYPVVLPDGSVSVVASYFGAEKIKEFTPFPALKGKFKFGK